jgi:hypothetical protein
MRMIIWRALGLDNKEGRVLTGGMGTQVLCGILRNLPKRWITDEGVKKALAELVEFASGRADARNYLAHGIWTEHPEVPGTPYLNFMKTGEQRIMPAAQAVKPAELEVFGDALDRVNRLAIQIIHALGADACAPMPDTSGEPNPAGLPTETKS